jgi:hypothetical protein
LTTHFSGADRQCSTDLQRERDDGGKLTEARHRRRFALARLAVLSLAVLCLACGQDGPFPNDLVRRHATRADVEAALGPGRFYIWYAPGTREWQDLLDSLSRENAKHCATIRAAIETKRPVMYYRTHWQHVWLILDTNERVESYCASAQ